MRRQCEQKVKKCRAVCLVRAAESEMLCAVPSTSTADWQGGGGCAGLQWVGWWDSKWASELGCCRASFCVAVLVLRHTAALGQGARSPRSRRVLLTQNFAFGLCPFARPLKLHGAAALQFPSAQALEGTLINCCRATVRRPQSTAARFHRA